MAKRAGIILDGPIVEKLRFLRMGIIALHQCKLVCVLMMFVAGML